MIRNLKKVLLSDPSNWTYWLAIAFITRLIFFILVIHFRQYVKFDGFWGGIRDDSDGYLIPFDNLLKTGNYYPDFRMPGYGVLYFPLIFIFSKVIACNIVIIIQLILSSLSVYALALIAKNLFNNTALFHIAFYLFAFSSFSSLLDPVLLTESLSTSTLILSTYFFTRFFNPGKVYNLFISGGLLTWGIFLHPVFCPFLVFFLLMLIVMLTRSIRKMFLPIFLFILPFILFDGAWVLRNYYTYHKVTPLTRSVLFPWVENTYLEPIVEFGKTWGAGIWFVDPKGNDLSWFINNNRGPIDKDTIPFPNNIYTSAFNKDSLRMLDSTLSAEQKNQYNNAIFNKLQIYTASIKKEKPYLYYIKSNGHRLKEFLLSIHTVSKLYINNRVTFFYNSYYYITLFSGILGVLLMIPFIFKLALQSIIPIIPIYIIIIHPFFIKYTENRYLIPAYPFMIICASYCFMLIYKWVSGYLQKQ